MKFFALALLFAVAQAATEFSVKDGNDTCLLLSLDGSVAVEAKNSSGITIGSLSLPFSGAKVLEASTCTTIKLDMTKSVQVWYQFTNSSDNWKVTPISAFNPIETFSLENETLTFKADALEPFKKTESFLCKSSQDLKFTEQGSPTANYTFTVNATVQDFQIQSLKGTDFANASECAADTPTTHTPTTSTTTATSSTAAPSTTMSPEPVVNATCKDNNTTRIRLTGSFQLAITYNATVQGKTVVMTKYIDVPSDASSDSSKCEANSTMETLSLEFFSGWGIKFNIVSDSSSTQLTATTKEYHVANITITYVFDEHLPNAVNNGTNVEVTYKDGGKNYLKATSSGYYTCKANTSISMGQNSVKLTSENLRYKAFNMEGNAEFKGDVSECSADDDTSSVVPIAVGAALAGLVVIVLIAYLIGRKRSRKSGYESV